MAAITSGILAGTLLSTAVIGGVAAVGVGALVVGTISAAKARKEQALVSKRRADLQAAQSRRAQVREARIRRGRSTNVAVAGGVGTSSGFLGNIGALGTQLGLNLSFLDTDLGLQRQGIEAGRRAETAGAIAGLGGTIASLAIPRI